MTQMEAHTDPLSAGTQAAAALVASAKTLYVAYVLRTMSRVVRPGGHLIVTLPNWWSPYRIWMRVSYRRAAALVKRLRRVAGTTTLPRREFRVGTWKRFLAHHGMVVTDVVYYGFNIALSPLDRIADAHVARLAARLESLARSPLGFLGTGVIVSARRRAA